MRFSLRVRIFAADIMKGIDRIHHVLMFLTVLLVSTKLVLSYDLSFEL